MLNFRMLSIVFCIMLLFSNSRAISAEKDDAKPTEGKCFTQDKASKQTQNVKTGAKPIDAAKLMNDLRSRDWHKRHGALVAQCNSDGGFDAKVCTKEVRLAYMDALLIEAKDPEFEDAAVEGGILSGMIPVVAAFDDVEAIDVLLAPDVLGSGGTNMVIDGLLKFGDTAVDHIITAYRSTKDIAYRSDLLFAARRMYSESSANPAGKQKLITLLSDATYDPLGEIRESAVMNIGMLPCETQPQLLPLVKNILKNDPEEMIMEDAELEYPVRYTASRAWEDCKN